MQNRQFDEKHATKWTSAVTHAEAHSFRNSTVITAQVVEMSVTVNDRPIHDFTNLDDYIPPVMTPRVQTIHCFTKEFCHLKKNICFAVFNLCHNFYLWLWHSLSHVTESGVNLLQKFLSL